MSVSNCLCTAAADQDSHAWAQYAFTRYRNFSAAVVFMCLAPLSYSQSSPTPSAADEAWREVVVAGASAQSIGNTQKTSAVAVSEQKSQAQRFTRAAEKAAEFYQKFPDHPNAMEAKKLEAVGLLRAVQNGDVTVEHKADRVAREYRNDTKNPKRDRFQVASLAKQMDVMKKQLKTMDEMLAAYEKNADDLMAEYNDVDEVYELYLGVARNAPPEKSKRVAFGILNRPAPAHIKEKAQAIINRLELPGKKLDLEFTDIAGAEFLLSQQSGKIVLVYFWATWGKGSMAALPDIKKAVASDVVLVGVNMDQDLETAKKAIVDQALPGIHHFDARGLEGSVATQLYVWKMPAVYVFDAKGVLTGFGSLRDLPSLLAAARK